MSNELEIFCSFSHKLFSSSYQYSRGMQVLLQYVILRSTQSGDQIMPNFAIAYFILQYHN